MIALVALAWSSPRLVDPVRPTALKVALEVDPAADTFTGRAEIPLEVGAKLSSFHLHGEELTVTSAQLTRKKKVVPATVEAVEGGRLRVDVDSPLAKGEWTLVLTWEGPIHEQPYGLFRFEVDGQPYLATQLEADDARTVWPCFDEPAFKVPFELSVTAPEGLEVIANGPVAERAVAGGRQVVRFEATPPIPTYAGALAIGPYESAEIPGVGVPSRIYVPRGHLGLTPAAIEELPGVVRSLEGWFGEPYPYAKLDLVAVPDFAFGAMENPGAIVMNESLLFPPERETAGGRAWLVEVLAHEVGHQWFGNLVTMAWWDDFWLNESFAQWIGGRTVQALHPEMRRDLDEVRGTQGMIGADGRSTARPLRTEVDPAAVFETANFAVYPKGEAMLSMVEAWIGPDAFQAGVRAYLAEHREGNATSADLFRAISAAGGQDVTPVMEGLLAQPGAPLLLFENGRVKQARYARIGAGELPFTPWTLPLRLRVGRPDGSSEIVQVRLDGPEAELGLGEVTWVLPTADGIGYYAWDQPDAAWEALLAAAPGLSVRDQLVVLGEIGLLVDAGRRDAGWALGLVGRLTWATDPEVVQEAVGLADTVGVASDLEDPALEAKADAWVRATLTPWLEAIGREKRPGEPVSAGPLRRRLLARLADAEDPAVLELARGLAERWLADPSSVDPELGPWAVGVWVRTAPAAQHEVMMGRANGTSDPGLRGRYLAWAAAVRDPSVTQRSLAMALDPALEFRDTFALIGGVADAHEDEEHFVSDWMMANYDAMAAKVPPQFRMYLAGIGGGCDVERFERTRSFFADPARAVPGTERVLAETEAEVRACVTRRETHGASVRAFLDG